VTGVGFRDCNHRLGELVLRVLEDSGKYLTATHIASVARCRHGFECEPLDVRRVLESMPTDVVVLVGNYHWRRRNNV
jgi:hypothetical protein